ncbi:MAG: hypothetical protein HQL21_06530 [Candidatus Omnitrophica bacterium]|nr:hypothetical protein [Candidatus Omnitrophota bacterium]
MDTAMNFSVTPFQAILAIGFQLWLLVFPILILRKLDRLTALFEEKFGEPEEIDESEPSDEQGT